MKLRIPVSFLRIVTAAVIVTPSITIAETMSLTDNKVITAPSVITDTSSYTSADASDKKNLTIQSAESGLYYLGTGKSLSFENLGELSIKDNKSDKSQILGRTSSSSTGSISMSNNTSVVLDNNDTTKVLQGGTTLDADDKYESLQGGVLSTYKTESQYNNTPSAPALKIDNNGSVTISNNNSTVDIKDTNIPQKLTDGTYNQVLNEINSLETTGGAIYAEHAEFSISGNGDVTISNNSITGTKYNYDGKSDDVRGSSANGGAVAIDSCHAEWIGNANLTFEKNTAEGTQARGGAVYVSARECTAGLTISNTTGTVKFADNKAEASVGYGRGGAISMELARGATVEISKNNNVEFTNNSSSGLQGGFGDAGVSGGAIFATTKGNLLLKENTTLKFEGNTVTNLSEKVSTSFGKTYYPYALGGAIASGNDTATVDITGNGTVIFRNNGVTAHYKDTALGGAMFTMGSTNIRDNENVLFEKNFEISYNKAYNEEAGNPDTLYRLRSIYAIGKDGNKTVLNLSARDSGSFVVKDSIYVDGDLELNAKYGDKTQNGTFVLSGKTTESDLNDIIAANTAEGETVRTATDAEIDASRTSVVTGAITLNAGTLSLQDGAVLQATKLIIAAGATLEIKNTTSQENEVVFLFGDASTDTLLETTLDADLYMQENSVLKLDDATVNLNGNNLVMEDNVSIVLNNVETTDNAITLFSNVGNITDTEGNVQESITIKVNGSNVSLGVNESGNVVFTVPEPTTATLSLLALAGLCARRRRK